MRKVSGRGGVFGKDNRPGLRPVEHIELSEKNFGLRLTAVVLLILISVAAFVYFVRQLVGTDIGWQEIVVSSSDSSGMNVSGEFTFEYNIGASGVSAATEKRALAAFYGGICQDAYEIFNTDQAMEKGVNVYGLNHSLNTQVTLPGPLYETFEGILKDETASRLLYSGPLYEVMENLFACETDSQAMEFDPMYNAEMKEYFERVNAFIRDQSVELILLADQKAVLKVSEEYLAFCEEYGIENIIDLYPFKNAFVIDYLADCLRDKGYTKGVIRSEDGFVQILDPDILASFTIYELEGTVAYEAAKGQENQSGDYGESKDLNAMISLKSFPLEGNDRFRYYLYQDGGLRNTYLSEAGSCATAVTQLVAAGTGGSCGALLLSCLPYYVSESAEALFAAKEPLSENGIYTAFYDQGTLYSTIPNISYEAGQKVSEEAFSK